MVRSEKLTGATYKLRWPDSEHAMYVTLNDIEQGGIVPPFEIMSFALTRLMTREALAHFGGG